MATVLKDSQERARMSACRFGSAVWLSHDPECERVKKRRDCWAPTARCSVWAAATVFD
jgi:hypothetical protein